MNSPNVLHPSEGPEHKSKSRVSESEERIRDFVTLTDEELVHECRNGEERAWEEIVLRYHNLLFSIPRRAGLGKDLASDVLQEVFVTLFQKINKLEQPKFVRAWLATTTRHKTMHLLQRELKGGKKIATDSDNGYKLEIPDRAIRADDRLVEIEKEAQIETALTRIEERCRQLLTMLYLDETEPPYSEIAKILDVPKGSVGPTRARCLKKLLKYLPE